MGKRKKKRQTHAEKYAENKYKRGKNDVPMTADLVERNMREKERERESFNRKRRKKPNMEIESLKPVNNLKG